MSPEACPGVMKGYHYVRSPSRFKQVALRMIVFSEIQQKFTDSEQLIMVEVRDSSHGIFHPCRLWARGLAR